MKRHIILVGLPGAGKSTVGRLVAEALGAPFVDPDEAIVQAQGISIAELFARRGEAAFRALERDAVLGALAGPPAVIAPGGGWAAQDGALDAASGQCLVVHLATEPAVAAGRLEAGGGRPLLAGPDPQQRMEQLWAARHSFYSRAHAAVTTDGRTPADVATEVVQLARSQGGW